MIENAGHVSPEGNWYDQDEAEWVIVLRGESKRCFDDRPDAITLKPGDFVNIPPDRFNHQRPVTRRYRMNEKAYPIGDDTVAAFFDQLTKDYTSTVERCFPRYREMLWALLDYLPTVAPVHSVLELGCGTGNLSVLLSQRFPQATIRLVDLSSESLNVCKSRFPAETRLSFQQADFRDLVYQDREFDLVISSIAIHHLIAAEKQVLFQKIRGWLRPGGIFAYADQHAGATDELYDRHIANWKQQSFAAGSTSEEWEMWMRHQAEHDHHDTLCDQIDWLRHAGLSAIDCPWRYLLWAVVQARKPLS